MRMKACIDELLTYGLMRSYMQYVSFYRHLKDSNSCFQINHKYTLLWRSSGDCVCQTIQSLLIVAVCVCVCVCVSSQGSARGDTMCLSQLTAPRPQTTVDQPLLFVSVFVCVSQAERVRAVHPHTHTFSLSTLLQPTAH